MMNYESNMPLVNVLQDVAEQGRTPYLRIVETAGQVIANASIQRQLPDGRSTVHFQTVVETPPGGEDYSADATSTPQTHVLERETFQSNDYRYIDSAGAAHRVEVVADGWLSDDASAVVNDLAASIDNGSPGAYRRGAFKELAGENNLSQALFIEMTRTSEDGQLFPSTSVDLHLVRYYLDEKADAAVLPPMIVQTSRIVSDPNTGRLQVGHNLNGEGLSPMQQGAVTAEHVVVANPLLEKTVNRLQVESNPLILVNGPLSTEDWMRLMTEPIDERNMLVPRY